MSEPTAGPDGQDPADAGTRSNRLEELVDDLEEKVLREDDNPVLGVDDDPDAEPDAQDGGAADGGEQDGGAQAEPPA